MDLYCLPYAGGNANIYYEWNKKLNSIADVKPFEYRGHGRKYSQLFYASVQEAADDVCSEIMNDMPECYAIYGHSFGSLVAYETVRILSHKGIHLPVKLILGGMRPPHFIHKRKKIAGYPYNDFMNEVYNMGATSDEIINCQELKQLTYEILKADFTIYENYQCSDKTVKLDVDVDIYTGLYDKDITIAQMNEWQNYFSRPIQIHTFNSGHFFAFEPEIDIFTKLEASLTTQRKIS